MLKIFYVTDIHGSEICWRKFLNAGPHYGADVVIVGGDITGKAMVPIVERGGHWETTLQDHHEVLQTDEEVRAIEAKIQNRGYYPIRVSEEEYRHMQEDPEAVDKRFREIMVEGTERWISMADDKLGGKVLRVIVCPGQRRHVRDRPDPSERPRGRDGRRETDRPRGLPDGEHGLDEPHAVEHVPRAARRSARPAARRILEPVTDPERTIFNFHAPPFGSSLDEAPALDENLNMKAGGRAMRPVGSTSVRTAIERVQPVLSLHGHIHEGKGASRIGHTLTLNPGSSYEEGVLQAALVNIDEKKPRSRTMSW